MNQPPIPPRPPRWAEHLLKQITAPHLKEEVLGDIEELFLLNVQRHGSAKAKILYIVDLLTMLHPRLWRRKSKENTYTRLTLLHPDMISNYFKVALRTLLKHRAYSLLNITGLAVGLATTILILLWVKDQLSYNQFHVNHDRIYSIMFNITSPSGETATYETITPQLVSTVKNEVPGVQHASLCSFEQRAVISYKNETFEEKGLYTDNEFLKIFSFPLIQGTPETLLSEPNTIIITQKLADKYFKKESPIGRILNIDKQKNVKVVGILADIPANSGLQFDYLMPFDQPVGRNWHFNDQKAFILLDKSQTNIPVATEQLNNHLKTIANKHIPDKKHWSYTAFALNDWHLRLDWKNGQYGGGGRIVYVRLFAIVALFVLLIACINFMNLSTARATQRAREVGVRKAIGADRQSLIFQFLGESVLQTLIAGILALALIFIVLPFFNELLGKPLTVELTNPFYFIIYTIVLLLTSLLAGIYPAFILSGFQPVKVLKGMRDRIAGSAVRMRQSLVVAQFTISILLIVGTIVVYQQINYIRHKNIGYNRQNLVLFEAKGLSEHHYQQSYNKLSSVQGVQSLTVSNTNFRGPDWRDSPSWPGLQADKPIVFDYVFGDYHLLPTMGLELKEGRNFSQEFGQDSANVIINQEAARRMNIKKVIGHEMSVGGRKGRIIGIVKDFHLATVHSPIEPLVIVCRPEITSLFVARIDGKDIANTLIRLESTYKSLLPGYPFNFEFANLEYDKMYRSETQIGILAKCFSILTIFISCLGLFGLASFTVERRTKEIGVRKALGASVSNIFGLISKEFIGLVAIALLLSALPSWYLMNKWLNTFTYHINMSWWVVAWAGAGTISITLLTVSFQSIKAAMLNPVKSLKSE